VVGSVAVATWWLGGGWGAAIDPAGSRAGCCASRVEIERRWKAIGLAHKCQAVKVAGKRTLFRRRGFHEKDRLKIVETGGEGGTRVVRFLASEKRDRARCGGARGRS